MTNIMKLINKYIELQKSYFPDEQVLSYFKDLSHSNVKEVVETHNLINNSDFGIILVFTNYKLIIASGTKVINNFINYTNDVIEEIEVQNTLDLKYVIFLCDKKVLCFWSTELRKLVNEVIASGSEAILLDKSAVLDGYYDILPANFIEEEEQFTVFKEYRSARPLGYHTKDSDFLFKTAFEVYWADDPKDETLIHYFERVYTDFIYGVLELPYSSEENNKRHRTIFKFWFKDLHRIDGCDAGVSHIEHFEFGECSRFHFMLACSNKENVLSSLESLKYEYGITIVDYQKSPTSFVQEFMHYESEVAYFNTYFVGIFNSASPQLFLDVFQKFNRTVSRYMGSAYTALYFKDHYTIEDKYYLKFGYFVYTANHSDDMVAEYRISSILPWFSLPDALVELRQRKSSEKKICDV